jgi:SHS2 domain-containing protein
MTVYRRPQPYEELDHTADIGVRVEGASAEEALARLVLAFSAVVLGGGEVAAERSIEVRAAAGEPLGMAVDVLRELLFEFDAHELVPASCEVKSFDERRGALLVVEVGAYDPDRHLEAIELKAITWHDAVFERRDSGRPEGGWVAQIIFDV